MLKQRIITAVILAFIVIGVIMIEDSRWVGLLFSLGLFFAARELLKLTLKIPAWVVSILALGFALLFWFSVGILHPAIVQLQALIGAGTWILIAILLGFYRHHGDRPLLARVLLLGLMLDLLWICAHGLIYLHQVHGGLVLLFLLTLVAVADIGAYFSGRRFGKRKLAPAISPSKTWEGVVGGLLANLLWIGVAYWLFENFTEAGSPLPLIWMFGVGLATAAISVVGDLSRACSSARPGSRTAARCCPGMAACSTESTALHRGLADVCQLACFWRSLS